ncbi:MAG: O-antigen ligase family protein [Endomicrobiales bacterium]|nr:O-antigen ligase family protein [Endomicrobiales bacterium]
MIENILAVLNYLFAAAMPVSHIVGYLACGLALVFVYRVKKELLREPVFLWMLAFVAYGLALVPFSADSGPSLGVMAGYFSHWVCPFILGYSLLGRKKSKISFLVYYAAFIILLILSVMTYYLHFADLIGKEFHLVQDNLLKGGRSHIALAGICLMLSFFSLSAYLHGGLLEESARKALPAAMFFFLYCMVLTGSRGYYIAGFVTYFGIAVYAAVKNRKFLILTVFLLSFLVGVAAVFSFDTGLKRRITSTNFAEQNIRERILLCKVALWEIRDRPLFGFGPGQGIKQDKYFARLYGEDRQVQRHPHIHSFFLNFLSDFGLVGFLIFGAIVVSLFRRLSSSAASADAISKTLAYGLIWTLVCALIGDLFDTLLTGPGFAMEIFWLAGITLRQLRIENEK